MRDLVEGVVDADGVIRVPGTGRGRRVTVNRAESPLAWLRSRGMVDARQHEAAERLRADHERAAIAPAVTMRWAERVDGGAGGTAAPGETQLAAKRRFDAAVRAVGRGLDDVLWRVICAGEGLPAVESALGWPTRSGRVILGLALDRLADHYRLG